MNLDHGGPRGVVCSYERKGFAFKVSGCSCCSSVRFSSPPYLFPHPGPTPTYLLTVWSLDHVHRSTSGPSTRNLGTQSWRAIVSRSCGPTATACN